MDIGCGGFNLPDQAGIPVDGDVTLVAEVPLIALLDLMRIRIPLFLLILGGRRRSNQCGVNDRALHQHQAPGL